MPREQIQLRPRRNNLAHKETELSFVPQGIGTYYTAALLSKKNMGSHDVVIVSIMQSRCSFKNMQL